MKCVVNLSLLSVVFLYIAFCTAKEPQFKLKNNSNDMIRVKIYKSNGERLDGALHDAQPNETISIYTDGKDNPTGQLSKIDVLYMVQYTAGDTFEFSNVTDKTVYYLSFTTKKVPAGAVVGSIGSNNVIAAYADVGQLTPQMGVKDNVAAAQIKKRDH